MNPLTSLIFVTDNENVYKTYNKGPRAGANSANCDLYKELFDMLYEKAIELHVRWMPSHLGKDPESERPTFVSHFDVLANDKVDEMARVAADLAEIPLEIASIHVDTVSLVRIIQKRLAFILLNLPPRQIKKDKKPQVEPKLRLCQLLVKSSHKGS